MYDDMLSLFVYISALRSSQHIFLHLYIHELKVFENASPRLYHLLLKH